MMLTGSLMKRVAYRGADERQAAADQGEDQHEALARAARGGVGAVRGLAGQRRDDAEALGGIVQAETDDQQAIPMAIISASRRAGLQRGTTELTACACDIAPGPKRREGAGAAVRLRRNTDVLAHSAVERPG